MRRRRRREATVPPETTDDRDAGKGSLDTVDRRGFFRSLTGTVAQKPRTFGVVKVSPACFGCNTCEKVCDEDALRALTTPVRFALVFFPSRCNACGRCKDVCLDHAITVVEAARPEEEIGEKTIVDIAGTTCVRCGAFSSPGPLCRICRASAGGRLKAPRGRS